MTITQDDGTPDLPLVSLIIPCHNESGILEKTLVAVSKQEYPRLQVIVVDDGSTDNTSEIVSRFPQFEGICHQKNRGLSAAYNTGIEKSRGEIIGTLHADCIPRNSHWISQCVPHFRDESVGIVSSPFVYPDSESTQTIHLIFMVTLRGDIDSRTLSSGDPVEIGYISGKCDFYRGDLLRRLRGFRPLSTIAGEDKDLSLRVRSAGYRIILDPMAPVTHFYGSHQQGLLANWSKAVQYGEVVRALFRLHGRIHSKDVTANVGLFLGMVFAVLAALVWQTMLPVICMAILILLKNMYKARPLLGYEGGLRLFLLALPIGMVDNLLMGFGAIKGPPRVRRFEEDRENGEP